MSQPQKKQNFLHGAALLAGATAIVKIIGALYKLPLKMVIGDEGYSYFSSAYDIYTVLLLISTAGLPVAMSRMISQATALGNYNQARRVYNTSRAIFLGLGAVSTLLMLLFCRQLAQSQQQPDAWFAIMCLAPCAFLMGIISTYRGFFQGQGNMIPTSVSQVIEAIFKLTVGLIAAVLLLQFTGSIPMAAGGAILGVTVSCVISVIYLFTCFRKAYADLPQTQEEVSSYANTAKRLLAIAIPITIGAAGLQLLTVIETSLYMDRLVALLETNRYTAPLISVLESEILAANPGISAADRFSKIAANLKGIYNMAQTIYNMPNAFITPITISIIPAVTAQLTLCNDQGVKSTEESAARVAGLLSLPCAVGLMVLSEPIMALLGGYAGEKLVLASQLMSLLGISVFLHAVVLLTNAIMQAHGHANLPVVNMLCSGAVKLLVVFILAGNPAIGILGVPLGTALCNLCIAVLNLICIRKCIPQSPALARNLLRSVLPAALMGAAAWLTHRGLITLLGSGTSRIILCGGPICVAAAVYVVGVVLFKAITREDCMLLPKGEKIAKLLHL
ncbi:MAG: polysaccharide biosynthesis protein [Oscillospiraceae bacterium]|nr:polysaccharide biosynthesis protein [Oscillospiraceae bacterium]